MVYYHSMQQLLLFLNALIQEVTQSGCRVITLGVLIKGKVTYNLQLYIEILKIQNFTFILH